MLYLLVLLVRGLPGERFLMLPFGARQAAIRILLYFAETFIFAINLLIWIVVAHDLVIQVSRHEFA
jgi:hypothetical protein